MFESAGRSITYLVWGLRGMTEQQFLSEAYRLIGRYGDKHYPKPVLDLIFKEVQMLNQSWFSQMITKLIATERFAPLLPQIKIFADPEKRKSRRDYREVGNRHQSIFDENDILEILKTVKSVAHGIMSPEAASAYSRMLESSIDGSGHGPSCKRCDDSGIVLKQIENSNPYATKCRCSRGSYRKEDYPLAT